MSFHQLASCRISTKKQPQNIMSTEQNIPHSANPFSNSRDMGNCMRKDSRKGRKVFHSSFYAFEPYGFDRFSSACSGSFTDFGFSYECSNCSNISRLSDLFSNHTEGNVKIICFYKSWLFSVKF